MSAERDFVTDHRGDLLADLDAWLRIPGISAQPEHHDDVRASADWFAAGLPRGRLPDGRDLADGRAAGGLRRMAERRRRRADRAGLRPPRRAAGRPDRALGAPPRSSRPSTATCCGPAGASDDKGQLLFHLLGLRAHLHATGRSDARRSTSSS